METLSLSINLVVILLLALQATEINAQDRQFWMNGGLSQLNDILKYQPIVKRAKNVILFIGDGMGISTVTASRIYKGQQKGNGNTGVEDAVTFEKFPNVALSKVYNTDRMVPDSAGSGTAIFSGVKTILGGIGVDGRARKSNCASMTDTELTTILDWSLAAGKRAGFVTTTRITHATPASIYAHTIERDWEGNYGRYAAVYNNTPCRDIARQFVEDNYNVHVAFGGGRMMFLPTNVTDTEVAKNGLREDKRDLITEWKQKQESLGRKYKYLWDTKDLRATDPSTIDYAFGLFGYDHLEYELDRKLKTDIDPSIAEMTSKAIQILDKGNKGFFLMVEGGRIDHAHHSTVPIDALEDTLAMDEAVKAAIGLTNLNETLIIVTSDHSHTFSIGGYPRRGSPILGWSENEENERLALDNMTYPILSYANGLNTGRKNFSFEDLTNRSIARTTLVKLIYESHGGEDVGIFAQGPMAHLFRGVVEENYIAHVAAYASCVGPYNVTCADDPTSTLTSFPTNPTTTKTATTTTFSIPSSTTVQKCQMVFHVGMVLATMCLLS